MSGNDGPPSVSRRRGQRAVFGLDSRIIVDPTSDKPLMLPIGRHNMAGALTDGDRR